MDGWMVWMEGWMNGWLDGWMAGWMDGWMNKRTNKQINGVYFQGEKYKERYTQYTTT